LAAAAMAMGLPELAKMFYYGKEFGVKKQKINAKGELVQEEPKPLSVTKAGAEGDEADYTNEAVLPVAKDAKSGENDAKQPTDPATVDALLQHIMGTSENSASLDDILNIVKGA
jgi:hypothetical protein